MRLDKSEWNRTFPKYMAKTKRDLATVLNTKLFYIARRATVETPKTDKAKISALKEPRQKTMVTKRGKRKSVQTTVAALIIQARRFAENLPALTREEAREAGKKMVAARMRSIAYLKSGWIPAIKRLEPLADRKGIPKQDRSGKQFGRPKGFAKPAQAGTWRPSAMILNDALPKDRGEDKRPGALKIAEPGLQRAFDHEVRSMKEYLERKLRDSAKSQGIKTN